MAKSYWDQDLDEFNPYYSQYYNKDGSSKLNSRSEKEASTSFLQNSEKSALSSSKPEFHYSGSGKNAASKNPKINFSGKRKGLATILILGLLIGGGVFLGSSNTLLAPAISSLFTNATNSSYAGYTLRGITLQNYMLRNLNSATSNYTWTGTARYRRMSSSFRSRLAANNIEIEGSGHSTILKWTKIDTDGVSKVIDIPADDFRNMYLTDVDFRNDYSTAKRSRVVTFFDSAAEKFYSNRGITRNTFENYKNTGDTEANTEDFRNTMSKTFDNDSSEINNRGKVQVETDEIDPETGEKIKIEEVKTEFVADSSTNNSPIDADTKARSYVANLSQNAAAVANGACSLLKIGNAISLTVASLETYQSIKYFLNLSENISKMMAGEGDGSAINEVMNLLTTSNQVEVPQFSEGVTISGINVDDPENTSNGASSSITTKTVTGSATQAQGFLNIMTGSRVNSDISNYSVERLSSTIARALGMSVGAVQACNAVQAGAAVISIATTIGTLGVSTIIEFAVGTIVNVGIVVAAQAILGFAIPTIAEALFTNAFETKTGVEIGEFFAKGAANANFRNGQSSSGQIPASKEAVLEYNQTQRQVATLDAEVDRKNLSPFDTSSPNTFLGSIMHKILPLTLPSNNIASTITRTVSKSIAGITGTAFAEDMQNSSYMTTFGNDLGSCPNLDEMGYACDIYGNPIPISTLIDLDPEDPDYIATIQENTDCREDGYCTIKDNSNLAKFIIANVNRLSLIGAVDTNILAAITDQKVNPIWGFLPIVGDAYDIYQAAQDQENLGWATGQYVGNTEKNPYRKEAQYFQRYVEDQRILDQIADSEIPNPVSVFIEKYETEHPADNSIAGYLSSITGLPKDTTETIVTLAEYYQFLENYDPSTRIAMNEKLYTNQNSTEIIANLEPKSVHIENTSSDTKEQFIAITQHIIYADVRNRSYTV